MRRVERSEDGSSKFRVQSSEIMCAGDQREAFHMSASRCLNSLPG